ncbi:MAG: hypothetical protein LBQ40_01970 [Clostridiales bacterium]|jgi:2-dehydropantoate 2-reductase|nr:hypothetical protein [Clostridiales bacterium]
MEFKDKLNTISLKSPTGGRDIAAKPRILIFGAGVIGSVYAVLFSRAGYDVSVYARSGRLEALQTKGLLYSEKGRVKKAGVTVVPKLETGLRYDFVFITVRYDQAESALTEARKLCCGNIVTMVNNPFGFGRWEDILGKGRLLPAFAGAGGRIDGDGVLHFSLTPRLIQPTTFGEPDDQTSDRQKALRNIFRRSHIPCALSKDMTAWQKSHLAMVTALADGIYFDGGDNYSAAKNRRAMRFMCERLRGNFNALKKSGVKITPVKLNVFLVCPLWLTRFILKIVYGTKFAERVISSHANGAKGEMELLARHFGEAVKEGREL